MDLIQAVVLALIQGVTEFLPISSSGHLILAPHLFGWPDQGLRFDIAANTGSLLAVIVYFRRDLAELIQGWFRSLGSRRLDDNPHGYLAWTLALATIPVGVCGLLFKDVVETLARDPLVIAATSILFGLLLYWSDWKGRRQRDLGSLGWREALIIGVAQAFALIPGTSRSGVTMTAALFLGFSRPEAARYSFLMAVPVGVLAGALDFLDILKTGIGPDEWMEVGVGLGVSALSAYWVIHWLLGWLRRQSMTPFVIYRIALGIIILTVAF